YCYYHLKQQIEAEHSDCLESCKQPCNETQYRLTMSMADWPSESSEIDWLLSKLGGQFGFWMGGSILCIIELIEILIDCLWITVIKVVKWCTCFRSRQAQIHCSDPPPTVTQSIEDHTNARFEPDQAEAHIERPCTLVIPGTPPPQYDSLRIYPILQRRITWDCDEN
ncbi:hypothetical protein chiPu_0014647, partial [Chiloscyllium punctatum]|nr:hypothetical protein [Chiloscyllium punctatum]